MERIISQQKGDKNKVYSLHAPEVSCIAKEKAHKEYELGSKVSVVSLSGRKAVVEIANCEGNPHDGKTWEATLDQVAYGTGRRYGFVLVDQDDRGHGQVGNSLVMIPSAMLGSVGAILS